MKTKVYLSLLFCVLFAFALTFTVSATSDNAITFTMESSDSIVKAGETFTVDIVIPANTGFVWAQISVNYDPAQVSPVMDSSYSSADFGVSTGEQTLTVKNRASEDDILVTIGAQTAGLIPSSGVVYNQTGKVITLTFKTTAGYEGPVDLSITYNQKNIITKDNEKNFVVTVNNPSITCVDCSQGHTPGDEATCTTDQVCVKCNTVLVYAFGHTEGTPVTENNVDPTCTTDGSYDTVVYCSVCKVELSRETTVVPALGHKPGAEVIENNVDPTCTTDGSYDTVVYCTVCQEELSRVTTVVPALGHTPGKAVLENNVDPTCTTDGSYDTVTYCTVCKVEVSRVTTVVPALGHTPGEEVIENKVDPTCTTDGSYDTVVYCTVCKVEVSRVTTVVDALGHTPGEEVIENNVDPTCTTDGSYDTVVYCTVCNVELSRETTVVPALGHTEGAAVIENKVDPTCTTDGSYDSVIYCTVCMVELKRETVVVDALGHNWNKTAGTAPTCAQEGTKELWVCNVCGVTDTENDGSAIPTLPHELSDYVNDDATGHWLECENCDYTEGFAEHTFKNGTCTVCGYGCTHKGGTATCSAKATCTICGKKYGNKLPHTPGAEATCTEDQVCTVCNNVLTRATGHTYVNHEGQAATCTETGFKPYQTCEKCDYTSYEEIAATGHTYVHHEAKAATCSEAGWDAYQTCENCDFTSYVEIVATGEHTYDNKCDADCNVCGATRTPEGHSYGDWVIVKEATTEAAGEKERTCSECGEVETQSIDKLPADNTGDNDQNTGDADKAGFPWWIIVIVAVVVIVVIVVASRKKGKK